MDYFYVIKQFWGECFADLADLHHKATAALGRSETVILSLNGRDPIPSEGSFSTNDIVQGTG